MSGTISLGDWGHESWVDDIAGAADHAAGSVDESIGRHFDDEEGGGFVEFETNPDTWLQPIRDGFSYVFENPNELVDGFEDTHDLPGGSPRDPLNLDGGPPGPEGGAGPGLNLDNIGATGGVVVLLLLLWLAPSIVEGLASRGGGSRI